MVMDKSEHKIGIIGGGFDPVHIGHLIIAEKAREEFGLQKVVFIPAGIPPHKKVFFASPSQRMDMVKIAIEDNRFFDVSSVEIDKDQPSYTFDTVSIMEQEFSISPIYLIVGEDAFMDLPSWHKYELLIKKVIFLVAPRWKVGQTEDKWYQEYNKDLRYHFISAPYIEIASSYIRDCFYYGKTVKYLIPDGVLEYVRRNNLYGFENVERKNRRGL